MRRDHKAQPHNPDALDRWRPRRFALCEVCGETLIRSWRAGAVLWIHGEGIGNAPAPISGEEGAK